MDEEKSKLAEALRQSKHAVAILGFETIEESNLPNFLREDDICDAEARHGYSLRDLFSARFYETRTTQFYKFYKEEILWEGEPSLIFYQLARLQRFGCLKEIITRDIFALPQRAGCSNVVSLNGSVYENWCQKCGKQVSLEEIKKAEGVPLCDCCKTKIRPNILLIGEIMNNALMTRAANAVEQSDLLLLIGTHIKAEQVMNFVRYYQGKQLVIINRGMEAGDQKAEIFIEGDTGEIFKEVMDMLDSSGRM